MYSWVLYDSKLALVAFAHARRAITIDGITTDKFGAGLGGDKQASPKDAAAISSCQKCR